MVSVESTRISVRIAHDGSSASVGVRPGEPAGSAELLAALQAAQVRSGLDEAVLRRLALGLQDPAFAIEDERVATGRAPEPGEDGRVQLLFREGLQPGHLREDGTLDFHDRELLKPVDAESPVARLVPARPGTPGERVDGTPIPPAPVREAALALGPGVRRDELGFVYATRAGVIAYKPHESLDVVERHVHQGAVDMRSGHLHMQGSLVVNGDVQRSFRVFASGDIEILGTVDGGAVYTGGSLRVRGGVIGGAEASVCAEQDLRAHHAELASLTAGRLLQIVDAVHARLAAARIEVSGKLRGGATQAEFSVIVREAGSPQGLETQIAVAEPLELPRDVATRALEHAKALRQTKMGPSSERAKGGKLSRVQAGLQESAVQRLAERERRRAWLARVAFVQVGLAHPGVTVCFGERKLCLRTETRATRFSIDEQTGELRAERIPP